MQPRPHRRRAHRRTDRWRSAVHQAAGAIGGESGAFARSAQVCAAPTAVPVLWVPRSPRSTCAFSHASRSRRWCVRQSQANVEAPPMQQPTFGAASAGAPPNAVRARRHGPPTPRCCVASRRARARRRRCSARCGVLAAPSSHASAALGSGADHRCHFRRRVAQRGARAPAAAAPP